jgi:hypothetical protein
LEKPNSEKEMNNQHLNKHAIWTVLAQHGVTPHPKCYDNTEGPWITYDPTTETIVISGHDKLGDCERALTEAKVPFVRHEGYIEIGN